MGQIYLHLDGQQAGPYDSETVRRMLAEGKISAQTLAWYQGLGEWKTVAAVLAAFPGVGLPPLPGTPIIPAAAAPGKGMPGWVIALIIVGCVALVGCPCLAGIALGPITNGIKVAREAGSMQTTRTIALAMFQYANDHNGVYPDGNTSTEVFQKLIDEKYVTDPGIFYIPMAGKVKATSLKLTADNVCYDATSGIGSDAPDTLPIVFSTGYRVNYAPGGGATRDSASTDPFSGAGVAVAYKSNNAHFIKAGQDGTVVGVVPPNFDPGTKTYRQLKP